jgi:uncharacterized membrane protein YphA (DoxX/SURF4 family)
MHEVFDLIATAMQVGLGLILAISGLGKLGRRHEFKGIVDAYRLVPSQAVPVAASIVVFAEIVTGSALAVGWAASAFAVVAAVVFAGFGFAMAINLARGRRMIDCGCFRSVRQPLEWRLVVRNVVCAMVALATSPAAMAPLDPQRWLHAVPAGIALAIVYFALNAVWSLDASRTAAFPRS